MKKLSEMSPIEQSHKLNDCIIKTQNTVETLIKNRFHQDDENDVIISFHALYIAKFILTISDLMEISKEETFDKFMSSIKHAMSGFVRKVN